MNQTLNETLDKLAEKYKDNSKLKRAIEDKKNNQIITK